MKTVVSSKGQIVLPAPVRRRLDLSPGTEMRVEVEAGNVVLKPIGRPVPKCRQSTSAVSGLPVLEIRGAAASLSSAQVKELLSDFP
jgi:AbrB family looped-hinge helix DNA binding protein